MILASLIDAFTACAAEGRDLPGRGHKRADSESGAGRRAGAVPGRKHGRGAHHDQPRRPCARAALARASLAIANAQRILKVSRKPQRAPFAIAGAQRIPEVSRAAFWRASSAPGVCTAGMLQAFRPQSSL